MFRGKIGLREGKWVMGKWFGWFLVCRILQWVLLLLGRLSICVVFLLPWLSLVPAFSSLVVEGWVHPPSRPMGPPVTSLAKLLWFFPLFLHTIIGHAYLLLWSYIGHQCPFQFLLVLAHPPTQMEFALAATSAFSMIVEMKSCISFFVICRRWWWLLLCWWTGGFFFVLASWWICCLSSWLSCWRLRISPNKYPSHGFLSWLRGWGC